MWVEYWNNKRWIPIEVQIGINVAPSVKPIGSDEAGSLQEILRAIAEGADFQDDSTGQVRHTRRLVATAITALFIGAGLGGFVFPKACGTSTVESPCVQK